MRYSSPLEILSMTLLWAAVLMIYDLTFNKHVFQPKPAEIATLSAPQLSMWLPHIGCTGKTDDMLQVLQSLPWLSKPTLKQLHDNPSSGAVLRPEERQCDVGVLASIRSIEQADFVELYRGLQDRHIIPTTIEFGGIPHFALRATLANLCDVCTRAAMQAVSPRKDQKGGVTFKWLDSKRVNHKDQSLTAFVRFNNEAHVDEMLRALELAGFPPLALRIVIE